MALHYTQISTKEALIDTIDQDLHTYHWFSFLVSLPKIKNQLAASPKANAAYQKLSQLLLWQWLLIPLFLGILCLTFVTQKIIFLWGMIPLLFFRYKIHTGKKHSIIEISSHLLSADFDQEKLAHLSLYQIGETYSRQHGIPSIIDVLYYFERMIFTVCITAFIFVFPIFHLAIWEGFLIIAACCSLTYLLALITPVYKYLR